MCTHHASTPQSDSSSSGVGRSANASLEGIALPRSGSPGGEPRGLNARTVSSSHEKSGSIAQRPGLFQRGSNGPHQSSASALSPSMTFQSRDRDRHGAGIQGGVLSGVAGPLSSRRRKDSEPGTGKRPLSIQRLRKRSCDADEFMTTLFPFSSQTRFDLRVRPWTPSMRGISARPMMPLILLVLGLIERRPLMVVHWEKEEAPPLVKVQQGQRPM